MVERVCALVDMILPPPVEPNLTRDYRLDDLFGMYGIACIPVRKLVANRDYSCLEGYDCIIMPQANADWVKENWDIYDDVHRAFPHKSTILVVAAHPTMVLCSGLTWYAIAWIRAVRMASAVVTASPHFSHTISLYTDSPIVNVNIPVNIGQCDYRRSASDRNGIYIVTYDPSRSGITTYFIASRLSKEFEQPVYGTGMYTRDYWESAVYDEARRFNVDGFVVVEDVKWTNHRDQHIGRMSEYKIALYFYQVDAYGRNIIDCAVAGLPCVCFEDTHVSRILYPDTAVPPCRYDLAYAAARRLLSDEGFARHVSDTATENLSEFNHISSWTKLSAMLERVLL